MSTLTVETGGRSWNFEEPLVVTIGRDPASVVALTGASTSRRHAELRSDGNGWVLVDVGSSSGTFLNGTRVTEVRLTGQTEVRFGAPDGEPMRLTVAAPQMMPPRPGHPGGPAAGIPPGLDQTIVPGAGPAFPGIGGGPGAGPGVLVRVGGEGKRFAPGTIVRIGRDPAGEVVVDDPSVSRLHATVEMRADGWWFFDRSTAGTFDEEDRVTQRRLEEPVTLMLGHPTAGVEVEVIPIVAAGQAQKQLAAKKRNRALVIGAAAAAVLVVTGGIAVGVAQPWKDDPSPSGNTTAAEELTDAELDRAKAASVWIIAVDESGQSIYTGSGSLISEDGLILTNAHVGKPSAPGQEPPAEDPAGLLVAFPPADDLDGAVEVKYAAEPLVADGVLDLAVLQITGDKDGNEIAPEDLDLPEPMPLGDSDDVDTGDDIRALGFPGLAAITLDDPSHRGLSVTRGVVSTFNAEEGVGDRAWIDSDIRIGSGNSGGASINNDGELVGINSAVVTAGTSQGQAGEFTGGSALIRPVDLAAEILEIAEAGGDPSYVSPYLEGMPEPPDPEDMTGLTLESGGWSLDGAATCATPSTPDSPQTLTGAEIPGTVYAEYNVTGVPDGTPFEIQFWSLNGKKQLGNPLTGTWDQGSDTVCIAIQIDIPVEIEGLNAVLVVGESGVDNPVFFS